MDRLKAILDQKKVEIAKIKPQEKELQRAALLRNDFRSLNRALTFSQTPLSIIAEVKKASPSVGLIAPDFNPLETAKIYEASGAHAISVLTDEMFFQGHLDYLTHIRDNVHIPVLRKDFIIDPVQVYESVCAGADAILLIVAALEQKQLVSLLNLAQTYQLDVLVEAHSLEEVDRALDAGADILGINNRNLVTFEVDLQTSELLSESVPDGVTLVAESGIKSGQDTQRLIECGVDAILVGETLMRANDIPTKLAELIHDDSGEQDEKARLSEDEKI